MMMAVRYRLDHPDGKRPSPKESWYTTEKGYLLTDWLDEEQTGLFYPELVLWASVSAGGNKTTLTLNMK
jgi:hypothetical protein